MIKHKVCRNQKIGCMDCRRGMCNRDIDEDGLCFDCSMIRGSNCPNCPESWKSGYDSGVKSLSKTLALYNAISEIVIDLTRKVED